MYLMEHQGEGERMLERDRAEALTHLSMAGMRAGDRVLDAGCASGWLTRLMAEQVWPGQATGVDLSPDRIALAIQQNPSDGRFAPSFVQGNLTALPFDDASFDVALSRYTFEYLTDPVAALRELKRVTRPGGRVVVADLDGNGMFHYPIPEALARKLQGLTDRLSAVGFDPFIGRKLYHLFYQVGFRDIQVQVMPHHLIAGQAPASAKENWATKLRVIAPYGQKALGSEAAWDQFVADCLSLLEREDTLTYSVTFLVTGVV